MTENDQPVGVNRRTVTKAMAWAVPAVAVAATVPYAAASPCNDYNPSNPCPVTLNGTFCKVPGGGTEKTYIVEATVVNPSGNPLTVSFDSMTVNGSTQGGLSPASITVDPHTKCVVTVAAGGYGDSANGQATVNYTINGSSASASTAPGNNIPQNNNTSSGCPQTIVDHPYKACTPM